MGAAALDSIEMVHGFVKGLCCSCGHTSQHQAKAAVQQTGEAVQKVSGRIFHN